MLVHITKVTGSPTQKASQWDKVELLNKHFQVGGVTMTIKLLGKLLLIPSISLFRLSLHSSPPSTLNLAKSTLSLDFLGSVTEPFAL